MRITKNISTVLIALFAIFVIIYACQPKEHEKMENNFSMAFKDHLLTKAEADTLQANYLKHNYKKINAGKTNPDAREVLHQLDVIEGYLQYVKTEADKRGVKNVGIKFVFGQYPENNPIHNQNPAFKGYQTIFLKPYTILPTEKTEGKAMKMMEQAPPPPSDPLDGIESLDYGDLRPPY